MAIVPAERIESAIHVVRGQRVMLDADLAVLYGVTTKRLNEQVKRNLARFPEDFMFRLTADEAATLKSQFATSSADWGGRRKLPNVFTEHGAVMLASILNSPTAVETSVQIVRAFVRIRLMLASNAELARKLEDLERRYDSQLRVVFRAIRDLMVPVVPRRKRIGSATRGPTHRHRRIIHARHPPRRPIRFAPGRHRIGSM
ncbi:MAG: ORF6N domain-containing protein [Gemmatimonadales bacterium]|nr:ORF6N domain-containing protein [Gemmatimonadales bacterium]